MWVPVLSYDDRYGLTYGVQIAAMDLVGRESRVALPLTWGGERRAGIEIEHTFERGVVSRLSAGGGIRRTEHPSFDVAERRTGGHARAERAFMPSLRLGVAASLEEVRFAGARDPVSIVAADLTLDTRTDPAFPRNAVWGRVEVERLGVELGSRRRHRLDANAAVGLVRGSVLSARVFQVSSDGPLPAYEQAFIGGVATIRGFRPGYRVSDNAAGASTAWTLPFGSPLAVARTGVRVFVDWAGVYAAGSSWRDASFDRGAGAGAFATVGAFTIGVDVARGGQRTRVHVRAGTRF
jgi:outer membrane protein assembly factor BamA